MTPEQAKALRRPFPAEVIGTLPKGGANLQYVSHATVTDRLLEVDPAWSWEPVAWAADGTPLIATHGKDAVLWIRLTIAGVTRLGVGTAPAEAVELPKQLISDALRNAAMRFGVALDLWAKDGLEQHVDPPPPLAEPEEVAELVARFTAFPEGTPRAQVKQEFVHHFGKPAELPAGDVARAHRWLDAKIEQAAGSPPAVPSPAPTPPVVEEPDGDRQPDASPASASHDPANQPGHGVGEGAAAVPDPVDAHGTGAATTAVPVSRIAEHPEVARHRARVMARTAEAWPDVDDAERRIRRYAVTRMITGDDRESFNDLRVEEAERLFEVLGWLKDGHCTLVRSGRGWRLRDPEGERVEPKLWRAS